MSFSCLPLKPGDHLIKDVLVDGKIQQAHAIFVDQFVISDQISQAALDAGVVSEEVPELSHSETTEPSVVYMGVSDPTTLVLKHEPLAAWYRSRHRTCRGKIAEIIQQLQKSGDWSASGIFKSP